MSYGIKYIYQTGGTANIIFLLDYTSIIQGLLNTQTRFL